MSYLILEIKKVFSLLSLLDLFDFALSDIGAEKLMSAVHPECRDRACPCPLAFLSCV